MIGKIHRAVIYLREMQEVGLYTIMADSRLMALFNGSPFFYVMFPFIGILFAISAFLNGYQLMRASNKNFDRVFGFIISGLCAVFANLSLLGAVISSASGLTFVLGPWFFLSSVLLAAGHQGVMAGLNLYRALSCPVGSNQRQHYLQAAIQQFFVFSLLLSVIGTVFFVLIFPGSFPLLATIFAATAATLIACSIVWGITPYNWKLAIKGFFHLGKTELQQENNEVFSEIVNTPQPLPPIHHSLFVPTDYATRIQLIEAKERKDYLIEVIDSKIQLLESVESNDRRQSKILLLTHLKDVLIKDEELKSQKEFPWAFQSFWIDKGEVEHIYDACVVLLEHQQSSNDRLIRVP